jgi:deazaflavin-dependent oxidoreductase (nitroreductase family)
MKALTNIGNFFIRLILSSPLHGMMNKNTLLIDFTGRKSGKKFSTPVNFTREGKLVWITSQKERLWWRNLKTNPEVKLTMYGQEVIGTAVVLEAEEDAAVGLEKFLRPAPQMARYYQIRTREDGSLESSDLLEAAKNLVVIEIDLK